MEHVAYISVGSNLGDKLGNCRRGLAALERPGIALITAHSHFYRTAPVDYLEQGWFINAAVRLNTSLSPRQLLDATQAVQREAGRGRQKIRFGPRLLDLDIIFYDDRVIRSPKLVIPHPRMHKRRFVLQPLCDIDPDIVHPLKDRRLSQLLTELGEDEQEIFPIDD